MTGHEAQLIDAKNGRVLVGWGLVAHPAGYKSD
jgi:hypothetical protein